MVKLFTFNPATDTDTDEKVKATAADTTAAYLNDKILVNSNLSKSVVDQGGGDLAVELSLANLIGFDTDDLAEGSTNLYFTEERVDDRVAALLIAGAGINLSYNDVGNSLTIASTITQYTDEMAQDAVGSILLDSSEIDFTYDDPTPSITAVLKTTGVTAATYGSASQVGQFTVDSKGRLTAASNVAIAITASQVTDFSEAVDDRVGALFIDGNGIDFTYNDGANTMTADIFFASQARGDIITRGASAWQRVALGTNKQVLVSNATDALWATIDATYISGFDESVDDRVAALLVAGTGISLSYNDAGNALTINSVWQRSGTVLSPATSGDTLQVGDGGPSSPSYAFASDPNTGLSWISADKLAIYAKAIEMQRWDATAGQIIINPAYQGFDMYWHTQNDSAGTMYVNGGGDSVWFGTGETPVVVGAPSKVNIQVGGIRANYGALSMTHIPTTSTASIIVPTLRSDFSFEHAAASVKTLTRSGWEQTYNPTMNNAGGSLILGTTSNKAMLMHTYSPTLTAGTLTDDAFRFVQYQRNINGGGIVEEADIHKGGIFRNRYSGVAAVALGVPPVPDSFVIAYGANYVLPDANEAPQLTSLRIPYVVQDKGKLVVGTGYIYVTPVIRPGTIATTGFTGDLMYTAVDAITNATWAGATWNNLTVMIGLGGIMAHYAGGVLTLVTATPQVYYHVPRYY